MDSQEFGQMQNRRGRHPAGPDDFLVRRCQSGDNQAFAELIKRHHRSAMKLALSILRDRQDAEDEVQNAFWKTFEHINQFQRDAKFSTWFTRIVVNQCLMKLRQVRRANFCYIDEMVSENESMTLDLPQRSPNPEQQLGQAEIGAALHQEIRRMPPLLRRVVELREVHEWPMPDVAKELGISVAAAKSRLLRARAELRGRLQKHQGRIGPATLFAS
jgi:RNA polymerase sigma-70 factor (ECF subfamily)